MKRSLKLFGVRRLVGALLCAFSLQLSASAQTVTIDNLRTRAIFSRDAGNANKVPLGNGAWVSTNGFSSGGGSGSGTNGISVITIGGTTGTSLTRLIFDCGSLSLNGGTATVNQSAALTNAINLIIGATNAATLAQIATLPTSNAVVNIVNATNATTLAQVNALPTSNAVVNIVNATNTATLAQIAALPTSNSVVNIVNATNATTLAQVNALPTSNSVVNIINATNTTTLAQVNALPTSNSVVNIVNATNTTTLAQVNALPTSNSVVNIVNATNTTTLAQVNALPTSNAVVNIVNATNTATLAQVNALPTSNSVINIVNSTNTTTLAQVNALPTSNAVNSIIGGTNATIQTQLAGKQAASATLDQLVLLNLNGLTNLPATGLKITNAWAAGYVLKSDDATNFYWAADATGGGGIFNDSLIGCAAWEDPVWGGTNCLSWPNIRSVMATNDTGGLSDHFTATTLSNKWSLVNPLGFSHRTGTGCVYEVTAPDAAVRQMTMDLQAIPDASTGKVYSASKLVANFPPQTTAGTTETWLWGVGVAAGTGTASNQAYAVLAASNASGGGSAMSLRFWTNNIFAATPLVAGASPAAQDTNWRKVSPLWLKIVITPSNGGTATMEGFLDDGSPGVRPSFNATSIGSIIINFIPQRAGNGFMENSAGGNNWVARDKTFIFEDR